MPSKKSTIQYPLGDSIGFVSLVDGMREDSALKVVNSARISYGKRKKGFEIEDRKLAKYLWTHGHTSPYRHSFYTLHVKMPLFVARQWLKYQVGAAWRKYEVEGEAVSMEEYELMFDTEKGTSWNEISYRYAKSKPEFYIPDRMRSNIKHGSKQASEPLSFGFDHAGEKLKMYKECERAYKEYEERIELGIAKELARMMLPQNLYTEVYWTVSLQALIHFLVQRLANDAQFEVRCYAEAVYNIIKKDLDKLGISKEDLLSI